MRRVLRLLLLCAFIAQSSFAYIFNYSIFRNPDTNQVIVLGGDEHSAFSTRDNQRQFNWLKDELKEIQKHVKNTKIFIEGYPFKYGDNASSISQQGDHQYPVDFDFGISSLSVNVASREDGSQTSWLGFFFHDFYHNAPSWPKNISVMSIESRFEALNLFFGPAHVVSHIKLSSLLTPISSNMYVTPKTESQKLIFKKLAPHLANMERKHEKDVARFMRLLNLDVGRRQEASSKSLRELFPSNSVDTISQQCRAALTPRRAFFSRLDHAILSTIVEESGSDNALLFFFVGDAHKRAVQDTLHKAKFIHVHSSPRDRIDQMYHDSLTKEEIDSFEDEFYKQLEKTLGIA